MRLSDLAGIDSEAAVTGFAIDHRNVTKGNIFGAFRGERFDGESFIPQAIAHGAVAVVARPEAMVEGAAHIADVEPRRRFAQCWKRSPGKRTKAARQAARIEPRIEPDQRAARLYHYFISEFYA